MNPFLPFSGLFLSFLLLIIGVSGCGSSSTPSTTTSSTEDTSTSGTVASTVGGAYNSSSPSSLSFNGIQFLPWNFASLLESLALASTACPTFMTAAGSGANSCAGSGGTITLTYSSCSFNSSKATWSAGTAESGTPGTQTIVDSTSTLACGASSSFFSSYTGTITRNFNNTIRATNNAKNTSVLIDTYSGNATTDEPTWWKKQTSPPTYPSGGIEITWSGGKRTGMTILGQTNYGYRGSTEVFKHTLVTSGALTISSDTVSGTITTYHDLAKVVATSTLTNLTFSSGCCVPTGGTITTTFAAVSGLTSKSGFVGTTETLTFDGTCGAGSYSGPEGYSGAVTLAHCL